MVVTRSIFLKGVGIEVLWVQLVPLLVMGVCIIGLSAARFRKSLE
jgi:ABC-2 type transport system permease protein